MMTSSPCAASIPPISALPYPFLLTGTTRAPSSAAMTCDPSVLPLSATMISADRLSFSIACCAFWMHVASVSASLRHGITIETSTACGAKPACCLGDRCATLLAHQPNSGARPHCSINAMWSLRPDLLRPSPRHLDAPGARHLSSPAKSNDPDGSPLESCYQPCG